MKVYKREINGIEHTFQYDDNEAAALKKRDVELVEVKQAAAPANKARGAANKQD